MFFRNSIGVAELNGIYFQPEPGGTLPLRSSIGLSRAQVFEVNDDGYGRNETTGFPLSAIIWRRRKSLANSLRFRCGVLMMRGDPSFILQWSPAGTRQTGH